jgi:hypothetical protein
MIQQIGTKVKENAKSYSDRSKTSIFQKLKANKRIKQNGPANKHNKTNLHRTEVKEGLVIFDESSKQEHSVNQHKNEPDEHCCKFFMPYSCCFPMRLD